MVTYVIDFSEAPSSSSAAKPKPNKLNPLGADLRRYILEQLNVALADDAVTSIVLTGGERHGNFSAGADLAEFGSLLQALQQSRDSAETARAAAAKTTLVEVVTAMEASPKPVVACIAGCCLGGGLEVALACHYRIAAAASNSSSTRLGLPEILVGVLPGAGGCNRLPRLIGLQQTLRLILTGTHVTAQQALKLKLVDAVVDASNASYAQLLETAVKWAHWAEVLPARRTGDMALAESPAEAHVMLHAASLQLPGGAAAANAGGGGLEGAHAVLDVLRAVYTTPTLQEGMQAEGEHFLQLLGSAEGMARRHVFFAVRTAQKPVTTHTQAWKEHPVLQSTAQNPVQTAVIGAGTMGAGIGLCLLQAGFIVYLVDNNQAALDKGLQFVYKTLQSYVKRGKLQPAQLQALQGRLRSTTHLQDLSECQLVVEAVVENLSIKQGIFQTLDRVTPPSAILVSNTSTLDINAMASVFASPSRRQQFAGWHFFSPAHVMKLVEIVVGEQTAVETVAILQHLTKQRLKGGKIGVVVGNCDGFCGNRLLKPYAAESCLLLVEGENSISQVDDAFTNYFGMMLGPLQMGDLAGNDVGYNIRKQRGWVRNNDNDDDEKIPVNRPARYTELADVMISRLGRLGQKVGKGWYDYDAAIGQGRTGLPSAEMAQLVQEFRHDNNAEPAIISPQEMICRAFYPLVNEGFKCLEEGIVRCPSDIDVVYVYGYGWPAWRGGPMHWADQDITLPVLLQELQRLARQFPHTPHFEPAALLVKCVEADMTVEEYYKRQEKAGKSQGQLSRL